MSKIMEPLNLDLLLLWYNDVKNLKEIKVLDIFESASRNLHPDGLFSNEIFGKVGEARRNKHVGYINLRMPILHPVYYKAIVDLKELYGYIMSGKEYAIFDKETKDFIKSDPLNGDTGYEFFISHLKDLKPEERKSTKREYNIELFNKYKDNPLFDKLLVLPAGMRDYSIDENGKPSEDEINTLYRGVMSLASISENVDIKSNLKQLDSTRNNLQLKVNAVYEYIINLLDGKNKIWQGKWFSRKIENSTRNVLTPYTPVINNYNSAQRVAADQAVVGTYQFTRTILPKAIFNIRDKFLNRVFSSDRDPVKLVDPKNLNGVLVDLSPEHYNDWMTFDGLEKLSARMSIKDMRHDYIMLDGYYLGLLWVGEYEGKPAYRFIQDVNEIPEELDKTKVKPISYIDLFYLSLYHIAPKTPSLITRYPVTGLGSIFPAWVYLKSTNLGEVRLELGLNWKPTGNVANEFPIPGDSFFDSIAAPIRSLARMGGDYDGDTVSFTCLLTEEAIQDIKDVMERKEFFTTPDGKITYSGDNDIIGMVMGNITG